MQREVWKPVSQYFKKFQMLVEFHSEAEYVLFQNVQRTSNAKLVDFYLYLCSL